MNKIVLFVISAIALVFMIIPFIIERLFKAIENLILHFSPTAEYKRIQETVWARSSPIALFKSISWRRYNKFRVSY